MAVARIAGGIVGVAADARAALGTAVATVGGSLRDEGEIRKLDVAGGAPFGLVHIRHFPYVVGLVPVLTLTSILRVAD